MGVHHATLSRLRRGARVETQTVLTITTRLGLKDLDVRACLSAEHVTAVSQAITRDDFHADSRWLAVVSGVQLDDVNIVLQQLLQARRLRMISATEWCLEGVPQ